MNSLEKSRLAFFNCRGPILFLATALAVSSSWAGDVVGDNLIAMKKADIYGSLRVSTGLVSGILYYDFDSEPTNNAVIDQSVYMNDGVVSGAIWTNAGYTNGSAAFSFDGVNDKISIAAGMLDSPASTKSITMTAWFKTTNSSGHIIGGYNGTSPQYGYGLAIGIGTAQKLNVATLAGVAWYAGGRSVNDGNWHFGAAVVSGSNYTIYVDQYVDGQGVCVPITSYTGARAIGHRADSGSYPFKGLIDDVRIYSTALSSQEVAAIRLNRSTPINSTNTSLLNVDAGGVVISCETTILRLKQQGDIGMGTFTNEP